MRWDRADLAEKVVDLLNEALSLDRDCVTALVERRINCNEALCDHPTIQVLASKAPGQGGAVGLLGILNGLVGLHDGTDIGYVCVCYSSAGRLLRFGLTDGRGGTLDGE